MSPALSTKSRKSTISAMHRNSYIEQQLTDDESSDSASYLDDFRSLRGERRVGSVASLRSGRLRGAPPQRYQDFEDDSENLHQARSVRSQRRSRSRAPSVTRSMSMRTDRNFKLISDSTNSQESETDLGTRALVQAKIREKIAKQSSVDESSSDFWKPKNSNQRQPKAPKEVIKQIKQASQAKVSTETQTTVKPGVNKPKEEPSASFSAAEDTPPKQLDVKAKVTEHQWECEYCTYLNEASIRICSICCKTHAETPNAASTPSETNGNVSTDQSKGTLNKISRKISFWPGTKNA